MPIGIYAADYLNINCAMTDARTESSGWLIDPSAHKGEVRQALSDQSFVGIDFGTSTSVISSILMDKNGSFIPRTLDIEQPEEFGGTVTHHLVNTVLAWHKERLLFGHDAYRLRQKLFEGKNVFSSFKMRLGIDIGPTYPETALRRDGGNLAIETAGDATREFFKLLAKGINEAIEREGLPKDYRLAISVPASFEANQRRDLLNNLQESGLKVSENCLIDEPNAAFLSFLYESASKQGNDYWTDRLRNENTKILVYDFGAGTCDVSILEIGILDGQLSSRNLAISRFTALGGDDFDRAIARDVLLAQLLKSAPGFEPDLRDIDERLIPRLQPVAEKLKIAAIKWLDHQGVTTLDQVRAQIAAPFEEIDIPSFKIRGSKLSLKKPTLTLKQLADAMEPLVGDFDLIISTEHVCAPVADAIGKSKLKEKDIDAVLFIGGSAANPVVRTSVMEQLPSSVKAIVPGDLRTHVSLGAALHSLGYHAFGCDLIRPITPETIFVIARGGAKEKIIPASSEVPSRKKFETSLQVETEGQNVVEIPICVGSKDKLLGLLKIHSPSHSGFSLGDFVSIAANITHDKLLEVTAEVAGKKAKALLLDPLGNRELSKKEQRMLEAKQEFNISLLESRGRPSKEIVLKYAKASYDAEAYETAAEMYAAVERIDDTENLAFEIFQAYYHADNDTKAHDWAKRAHQREPTATTAYNLSIFEAGRKKEVLLRQARKLDPERPMPMFALGRLLINMDDEGKKAEGKALLEMFVELLAPRLQYGLIEKWQCHYLSMAAELIGQDDIARRAEEYIRKLPETKDMETKPYDERNLAAKIDKLPSPMLDE